MSRALELAAARAYHSAEILQIVAATKVVLDLEARRGTLPDGTRSPEWEDLSGDVAETRRELDRAASDVGRYRWWL